MKQRAARSVLMLTNSLDTGGVETHIIALAKSLTDRGCFVAVASAGGSLEKELADAGILHIYAPLDSRLPHRMLYARSVIKKAQKDFGFDVIHAHSRLSAFVLRLCAFGNDVRLVTTAHLDFKMLPLMRYLSFWGEKTLAVSEDIRGYLIKEYGLSYENISLTVNGIDTERFAPKEKSELPNLTADEPLLYEKRESLPDLPKRQAPVIVHVSRMDEDRAYTAFLLLGVIGRLHEETSATLTLVGGGTLLHKIQKRAAAVNRQYGEIVTVAGAAEDVLPFLQKATVFVGVSRAALEAMACGVPTVLSGNTGYLGVFRETLLKEAQRTNFCCRGHAQATENDLYTSIKSVLSLDSESYQALSEACRACVCQHYSLAKMTDDYQHFYDSLKPFRRKPYQKTVILGYHGFGNLGDEAILQETVKHLRYQDPERGITVISHDPARTARDLAVSTVGRRHFLKLIITMLMARELYVGGGTLLQTETSRRSLWYYAFLIRLAKLGGAKVIYLANGIGPFPKGGERLAARLLRGRCVVTLRDEDSFAYVTKLLAKIPEKKRPKVALAADSGLLIKPCDEGRLEDIVSSLPMGPYFVIATNGCVRGKKYRKIMEKTAILAVKKGYFPLFLVMQPTVDTKISQKIAKRVYKETGKKPVVLAPSPRETVGIIQKSAFVLSSRLHPLIFAASCGVPALSYAKSPKCHSFARDVFGEGAAVHLKNSPNEALTYGLYSLFDALAKGQGDFYPREETVKEMKDRAEGVYDRISAEIEALDQQEKEKRELFAARKGKRRKSEKTI